MLHGLDRANTYKEEDSILGVKSRYKISRTTAQALMKNLESGKNKSGRVRHLGKCQRADDYVSKYEVRERYMCSA